MEPQDVENKPSPRLFDLMAMGLSSALMVGGGLGVGIGIDDWLHSSPVATFLGLALGVVAAIAATVRQARRYL
ncbi:MAG: AtpZ/AtpI family protein [Acidimicrobiales bacterium]